MNTTYVVIAVLAALALFAVAKSRKKKDHKPDSAQPPAVTPPTGTQPTPIKPPGPPVVTPPTPIKPPTTEPGPGIYPPPVEPPLLDRNRKKPGDAGYDPRMPRPDPESSPEEPEGTYYGEGVFNPNGRHIDLKGVRHNF